jgi:hypothetical protein
LVETAPLLAGERNVLSEPVVTLRCGDAFRWPLMGRREWLRRAIALLLGASVLPACGARLGTRAGRAALNELFLHILGIEDRPLDLLSRITPGLSPWKADLYEQVVQHARRNYGRDRTIDYRSFFEDVEKENVPSAAFAYVLEMMRAEAIAAFYTSREGWRLAGFDGPPVRSTIVHYWMRRIFFPSCNAPCHSPLRAWNLGERFPGGTHGRSG